MISCGEASGDLYAGALAAELRRRVPDAEIFGFGGPELRRAGGELIGDFTRFSVTGLVESLRVIPRSVLMLRRLIEAARERRPDVFVPIDFPDFNFRLMAGVRRLGIPIVYYVSPQLWAWRPGRMKTMQASVDRVLVIFPFEERIYTDAGVDVRFVGHPLVDAVKAGQSRAEFLAAHGLVPDAPTVAEFLPGVQYMSWLGLATAPHTPRPIVDKMNAEIHRALELPDVKAKLAEGGNIATPTTPEAMGKQIEDEIAHWRHLVQANNIKVD